MDVCEFIVDLLNLSSHHGPAGAALQEYVLELMTREVADLEILDEGEPARYFSAIHHGATVSERRCYGEHFRLDESYMTVLEHWQARLQHLQISLENPPQANRQALRAVGDLAGRHELKGAEELVLHLWGSGWLLDLEQAARLLWQVRRADVGRMALEIVEAEMELCFTMASFGSQSPAQLAAECTRQRGIPSPVYERHAGSWFGLTDMRIVRSREHLSRTQPFLDVIHNESLIYHCLRYFLQEAYLLENPYLRTLEKFIEDNQQRCNDCEDLLRLGHRAALITELDLAIEEGRFQEAEALLTCNDEGLRIGYPGFVGKLARELIAARKREVGALSQKVYRSMGPAQRLAAEFGWRTRGTESVEEARQVLQQLPKPL